GAPARLHDFPHRVAWFLEHKPEFADVLGRGTVMGPAGKRCLAIVDHDRLRRLLEVAFDESEFLSPHGLRALSRRHLEHPLDMELAPGFRARLGYEPGESQTGLFGGNSNWRGTGRVPPHYPFPRALVPLHTS